MPDRFTTLFYQTYWDIVGSALIDEVKGLFATDCFPPHWNYTNLCLIPKIEWPSIMKDFRLITLCNVTYKIIYKILVQRLKSILSSILLENQAAFTSGRYIADNVLVSHEVIHSLQVRRRCENSYMLSK